MHLANWAVPIVATIVEQVTQCPHREDLRFVHGQDRNASQLMNG
jgi:hypothetical protein